MTRLFTDGAESGDAAFFPLGSPSASTTSPRTGSYCFALGTGANATLAIPGSPTELYIRFGFIVSAGSNPFNVQFISASGIEAALTYTLSTNIFSAFGQNWSVSRPADGWVLIEIYCKLDNSVGRFVVKFDGVIGIDYTGDTLTSDPAIIQLKFINSAGVNSRLDDIAVNNTNGSIDNSWCGDGKIIALLPNADGDSSQWLGSDGNNTNNYQLVDERPPSDSDYVRATGSGYIDSYNLSTFDFAGQTIERIWMVSRAKSDAAGDYILHGIKTGGTNYLVTGSLPTSFTRIDISSTGTWGINPDTSLAWTQEDIDGLQVTIQAP